MMHTRVLDSKTRYIPQRQTWWGGWIEITDTEYEESQESSDDFDSTYDPHRSAELCACRYAAARKGGYIGTVKQTETLLDKFRNIFRGPMGPQGFPGAPGCTGPKGDRGEPARRNDDLLCPHCLKYRTDPPQQFLFLEVAADNVFLFNCKKCGKDSMWLNYHGLLMNERSIKR